MKKIVLFLLFIICYIASTSRCYANLIDQKKCYFAVHLISHAGYFHKGRYFERVNTLLNEIRDFAISHKLPVSEIAVPTVAGGQIWVFAENSRDYTPTKYGGFAVFEHKPESETLTLLTMVIHPEYKQTVFSSQFLLKALSQLASHLPPNPVQRIVKQIRIPKSFDSVFSASLKLQDIAYNLGSLGHKLYENRVYYLNESTTEHEWLQFDLIPVTPTPVNQLLFPTSFLEFAKDSGHTIRLGIDDSINSDARAVFAIDFIPKGKRFTVFDSPCCLALDSTTYIFPDLRALSFLHPLSTNEFWTKRKYNAFGIMHGSIIFPNLSLVNHSCKPNSKIMPNRENNYEGALEALRDIQAGEQISISYIHLGTSEEPVSTENRKWELQNWGFECKCEACSLGMDTPLQVEPVLTNPGMAGSN